MLCEKGVSPAQYHRKLATDGKALGEAQEAQCTPKKKPTSKRPQRQQSHVSYLSLASNRTHQNLHIKEKKTLVSIQQEGNYMNCLSKGSGINNLL